MVLSVIFVLIIFALFAGITYRILLWLTKFVQSLRMENFKASKNLKQKLIIVSCVVAASATYFFLFTSPTKNYKTAYIERKQQAYKVTIKGKRLYMFHDPVSLFLRKTYEDSAEFEIPRATGVIDGFEIPNNPGSYTIAKGNAIVIHNNKMTISLFYNNVDSKKRDPSTWNGDYELQWRN